MRRKAKKASVVDPNRFLLEQIEKSGGMRMIHAKFLTNLVTEISNSNLKRILPPPHDSTGIADDIAATLVIKYLEKHRLVNSVTALNAESQGSILATHATHALHFTSRNKSIVQLMRARRAHPESDYSKVKTEIAMKLLALAGDRICTPAVRSHLMETIQKSIDKPAPLPAPEEPPAEKPSPRKPARIHVKSRSKPKPKPEPAVGSPSVKCSWKWVGSSELEDELESYCEFVGFNEYMQSPPIKPAAMTDENDTFESDFSPPSPVLRNDDMFVIKPVKRGRGPGSDGADDFVVTKLQK